MWITHYRFIPDTPKSQRSFRCGIVSNIKVF
uniref:Uncharacterized protein n=1 Tax=Anguilla anguilla TaxID=7936 RepID=A0A0E9PR68_ANGAN